MNPTMLSDDMGMNPYATARVIEQNPTQWKQDYLNSRPVNINISIKDATTQIEEVLDLLSIIDVLASSLRIQRELVNYITERERNALKYAHAFIDDWYTSDAADVPFSMEDNA